MNKVEAGFALAPAPTPTPAPTSTPTLALTPVPQFLIGLQLGIKDSYDKCQILTKEDVIERLSTDEKEFMNLLEIPEKEGKMTSGRIEAHSDACDAGGICNLYNITEPEIREFNFILDEPFDPEYIEKLHDRMKLTVPTLERCLAKSLPDGRTQIFGQADHRQIKLFYHKLLTMIN